jgi:hypothetical protein
MHLTPSDRAVLLRGAVAAVDHWRCRQMLPAALREGCPDSDGAASAFDLATRELAEEFGARISPRAHPPRMACLGVATACTAGGWNLLLQWRAKAAAEVERLQFTAAAGAS